MSTLPIPEPSPQATLPIPEPSPQATLPIPEPSPQAPSELAVELLKEAKKLLPKTPSGRLLYGIRYEDGICCALARATEVLDCKISSEIKEVILQVLAPYVFYDTWVNKKLGSSQTLDAIQEARHRWVDQLIEDFGGTQ